MDIEKFRGETDRVFGTVPKTHNCAQAVVEIAGRPDLVAPMANCGGGRAEGGLCGALWGALAVTPEKNHEAIRAEFERLAGSTRCREIKGTAKTPCRDCVAFGAALAERYRQ